MHTGSTVANSERNQYQKTVIEEDCKEICKSKKNEKGMKSERTCTVHE
jgi:hypothetical protein